MGFFSEAINVLSTLVIALGAGLAVWGVVNLLEGYGSDNPGAKSQGIKQLMGDLYELLRAQPEAEAQRLATSLEIYVVGSLNVFNHRTNIKADSRLLCYIEPGSPWENGYCESFNARMRDEFLNGEILDTLTEAEILTRRWVNIYNTFRPHSSLGYRPPAPQTGLISA